MIKIWAKKFGIPERALTELYYMLGALEYKAPEQMGMSEAAVQSRVRLKASKSGMRLWRNNVGAASTSDGRMIRYGLANESTRISKRFKSSDLIGIKPIKICQNHIGRTIGQFVAIETKRSNWVYKGESRESAQLNFIILVAGLGGLATFARSEKDI